MKILTNLTDWIERKAERGKGVGNIVKTRTILAIDSWNWIVGEENGKLVNPHTTKYYGSFKQLCTNEKLTDNQVQNIIDSLCKLSNKKSEDLPVRPEKCCPELGMWIDNNFDTSFFKEYPPKVMERLFGNNDDLDKE